MAKKELTGWVLGYYVDGKLVHVRTVNTYDNETSDYQEVDAKGTDSLDDARKKPKKEKVKA